MWPAMWTSSFSLDVPDYMNEKIADLLRMSIVTEEGMKDYPTTAIFAEIDDRQLTLLK